MTMFNSIYKKTIKLLLLCGIAITLGGCEDVFDQSLARISDSRLSFEDVVNDASKVEKLYKTCYSGIQPHRLNIHMWVSFESLTDNAFDDKTGASLGFWQSGSLSPSQSAIQITGNDAGKFKEGGSYWGVYWEAIRNCNVFINNIDQITVPEDDLLPSYLEKLVDEARILRAYYHIRLLGMYGPVPFLNKDYSTDPSFWNTVERPDFHTVAVEIANELQEIIDNDKVEYWRTDVKEKDRVPLAFAYGLKSRVLLYSASPLNNPSGDPERYRLAAEAAKQFIDRGGYSLVPFENSKKELYNSPLSSGAEQTEIIWRSTNPLRNLSFVGGMDLAKAIDGIGTTNWGRVGETPTQEIVDCYELKTGEMIVDRYDNTHANPTFTAEAINAGYDDVNNPYANRDARFYRDIIFNGNYFGKSYEGDSIVVYTYQEWVMKDTVEVLQPTPGTGNNGPVVKSETMKQTFTGYYFGKDRDPIFYGKQKHQDLCNQHSVIMRFAEIYLNYAEALCGAGQLSEACDALDMTRLRAYQPSIKDVPGFSLDKEWLMKRIYNERRVELVLEDHRFFDVRRWDVISNNQNNTISGMLAIKEKGTDNTFKYQRYQLPHTWECHNEKYKVLPIPAADQKNMPTLLQPEAWQ